MITFIGFESERGGERMREKEGGRGVKRRERERESEGERRREIETNRERKKKEMGFCSAATAYPLMPYG